MNTSTSRKSSKTQIILREMTHSEKKILIESIISYDIKKLSQFSLEYLNLNFFFPSSLYHFNFDKEITPLLLCCYLGKFDVFQLLLINEGIDINLASKPDLYSPLMISCFKGYYEIVRKLLENNANIRQKNINGQEAFVFCFNRLEQKTFLYENKKLCFMLIELLIEYGADINIPFDNKKMNSILMKLLYGDIKDEQKCFAICDVIKFLIEKGIDINYKNKANKNIFFILKNNNKILPKYKQEILTILNNYSSIQKNIYKNYNNNILTLYSSTHGRYNSSTNPSMKSNDFNKCLTEKSKEQLDDETKKLSLESDDEKTSICCLIF